MATRKCVICGTKFTAGNYNAMYCCDECRKIAIKRNDERRNEKRKAIRHMENAIGKDSKLDKRLEEAREKGLSYAELQKQKTLQMIAKGEL